MTGFFATVRRGWLRVCVSLLLSGCNCGQEPKPTYSILVTPGAASVLVGASQQLTATITDDKGVVHAAAPNWASSNDQVAGVSTSGLVTGQSAGTATVTATFQSASSAAQITVTAPATTYTVTVTPATASINAGATVQLTAVITDNHGAAVAATPVWTSSSSAAATVDGAGLVKGVAAGTSTITAAYGGASGTAQITVNTATTAAGSISCIDPPVLAALGTPTNFTLFGTGLTNGSAVLLDGAKVFTVYSGPTADFGSTLEGVLAPADVATPRTGQVTVSLADGGTTNGLPLIIRAQPAGYPLLVSAGIDGGTSHNPYQSTIVINQDGRFLLFTSGASDLVPGVTEGTQQLDVFLRDTCSGATGPCTPATQLVSTSDGGHVTGSSGTVRSGDQPAISADGRHAAFVAGALFPGVPSHAYIYVRDTCAGADGGCTPATAMVSLAPDGGPADSDSQDPALSPEGRFVAFVSAAPNLEAAAGVNPGDVFLRDTCLGAPSGCTPQTLRVSVALDGGIADQQSHTPSVSAGGRYVAFASDATNLIASDGNASTDIFLRDTCVGASGCTPATTRLTVATDGGEPDNASIFTAISADGRFVAFQSAATNLIVNDQNANDDIFLADTCKGASGCTPSIMLVSESSCGRHYGEASRYPSLSKDGRTVGFLYYTTNNTYAAVRDTCAGAIGCAPATMVYSVPSGNSAPAVCGDGRCFAYPSDLTGQVYLGPSFLIP